MPEQTFETKAMNGQLTIDEAEGIVEAFVAGIGNKDSVGDIVLPGAFDASLKRRKPRVVWGHNWNEPIGKVLEIYEVGPRDPRLPEKMKKAGIGGLFARVQFNLKSERGREAFANILFFGAEQEWSIGYKTITAAYDNARQANMLREVELYEVSPVLHGANQLTGTISIKSDNGDDRVTSFRKSKWPMFDRSFAEMIKEEHPGIWNAGGNIKGDDQYTILTRIAEQGGVAETEDQIKALELREAWVARHEGDFRLPGVIAQIKWLAIGSRGEDHMKDVVREAIKKAETKGHGEGYSLVADVDDDDPMEELSRIAARMRSGEDDDDREEERDESPTVNDSMGRRAVLARAIANEMRTPVRIRTITGNTVVFDLMGEDEPVTMRASWHAEDGRVMVGRPERVRIETVYVPMDGGEGEAYTDDEQFKATDPRAGIPQERITGDILRGYGPRRGNLERLLRYWRPIMRKPGGFRRCLVILADHPELYPLQNICAWLHHETTGLWPNEGCHHPGMKNCRRKLRGVVRGSLWSDSEFNNRLRRLRPDNDGKGMPDPFDWDDEKGYGEVTDDDVEYANKVLNWFVGEEKEFMEYLADEKNWMHDGEDEEGNWMEHEWVKPEGAPVGVAGKPGGCGCGCEGKGSCGMPKSIEDSLVELQEKVGRVLNSRNASKITQAIQLLTEVLGEEPIGIGMQRKDGEGILIEADPEELFDLKHALDPVLEYHGLEAECVDEGIIIFGLGEEAEVAIKSVLGHFDDIEEKAFIGRGPRGTRNAGRYMTVGRQGSGGGIGRRIRRMLGRGGGGSKKPVDGDGDGKYSRGPGLPDDTPMPAAAATSAVSRFTEGGGDKRLGRALDLVAARRKSGKISEEEEVEILSAIRKKMKDSNDGVYLQQRRFESLTPSSPADDHMNFKPSSAKQQERSKFYSAEIDKIDERLKELGVTPPPKNVIDMDERLRPKPNLPSGRKPVYDAKPTPNRGNERPSPKVTPEVIADAKKKRTDRLDAEIDAEMEKVREAGGSELEAVAAGKRIAGEYRWGYNPPRRGPNNRSASRPGEDTARFTQEQLDEVDDAVDAHRRERQLDFRKRYNELLDRFAEDNPRITRWERAFDRANEQQSQLYSDEYREWLDNAYDRAVARSRAATGAERIYWQHIASMVDDNISELNYSMMED